MTFSPQRASPRETKKERPSNEHRASVVTIQSPPQAVTPLQKGEDNTATPETTMKSQGATSPFAYPAWPSSQPGPQATAPLPGQLPHPKRTDQMIYHCYDQIRGRPCDSSATQSAQNKDTRPPPPNDYFQEIVSEIEATKRWRAQGSMSEGEALERWLDDGGSSDAAF